MVCSISTVFHLASLNLTKLWFTMNSNQFVDRVGCSEKLKARSPIQDVRYKHGAATETWPTSVSNQKTWKESKECM